MPSRPGRGRPSSALLPGALLAIVLCGAYALAVPATRSQQIGGRSNAELVTFSARPSSYLVATPDNVLWGQAFASRGRLERRLFPGALAVLLALVGLLLRRPPAPALVYLLALVLAFDMSLGLSGHTYRFLYEHVPLYQGLRALARLGIFVVFFLAALAGYGYVALAAPLSGRGRMSARGAGICARPARRIPRASPGARAVSQLGAAAVCLAGAAAARRGRRAADAAPELPGDDPRYSYLSTFHWQPIVNGYSGFYPASYLSRLDDVSGFPDERSIQRLRRDGVRYLIVHLREFDPDDRAQVVTTLHNGFGLAELARLSDGRGDAVVFGLR